MLCILLTKTNDQVNLKRLKKDNPQYLRCRRATCENIKSDFFGTKSNYSGISVIEVFKVENRPMLRAFQKRAANLKPGSVKGLFCACPESSLEKLIVQGMHRKRKQRDKTGTKAVGIYGGDDDNDDDDEEEEEEDDDDDDDDDFHRFQVDQGLNEAAEAAKIGKALFTRSQYTPGDQRNGFAESKFCASKNVPFPCTFSRYSTLEKDRLFMEQETRTRTRTRTRT